MIIPTDQIFFEGWNHQPETLGHLQNNAPTLGPTARLEEMLLLGPMDSKLSSM